MFFCFFGKVAVFGLCAVVSRQMALMVTKRKAWDIVLLTSTRHRQTPTADKQPTPRNADILVPARGVVQACMKRFLGLLGFPHLKNLANFVEESKHETLSMLKCHPQRVNPLVNDHKGKRFFGYVQI